MTPSEAEWGGLKTRVYRNERELDQQRREDAELHRRITRVEVRLAAISGASAVIGGVIGGILARLMGE